MDRTPSPGDRIFQAWWWSNSPEERDPDLGVAEKTYGSERESLEAAQKEIRETDPPHQAFVNEYRITELKQYELVDQHDDPRTRS